MRRAAIRLCSAATAGAASTSQHVVPEKQVYEMTKRIRLPMDQMVMQQIDAQHTDLIMECKNVGWCCFLLPTYNLQHLVHKRYEVESIANGPLHPAKQKIHELFPHVNFPVPDVEAPPTDEKLSLAILNFYQSYPLNQAKLASVMDPPPHSIATIRTVVMDRIYWQRTNFNLKTITKSMFFGRMMKDVLDMKVDFQSAVEIDCDFNKEENKYNKFSVKIPNYDFELNLQDTGKGLLESPVVPGFLDNESALRCVTLPTEINSLGTSGTVGTVYRQPMFLEPTHPNMAEVVSIKEGSLFTKNFGCEMMGAPVACMLSEQIPKVSLMSMEGDTEDENEPYSTTHNFHEGGMRDRIQRRAMNRYNSFRDEIRSKAISDIEGTEVPRA